MTRRNNFTYSSGKQLDISYNALNLPRKVDNGASGKMQFLYNASGQKLRTTLYDSPSNITDTSDYIGNFVYKNGQLSYILMPEGRILPNGSSFAYEYRLKDQLGNTRATYIARANGNATLTQTTAYYPFGLPINALSSNLENNPYLYNGKELHSELNLDLFDYGKRFYDAEIGRFTGVDPIAEDFHWVTPYNYAENSPIANIDFWGLQAVAVNLIQKYVEFSAKIQPAIQKVQYSSKRIISGNVETNGIPNNNLLERDKKIINTVSKLKDVNNIIEGTGKIAKISTKETARSLQNLGTGIKEIGYGAAPFTEGASLAIVPVGEAVDMAGTAIDLTVDLVEGNFSEFSSKAAIEIIFNMTGKTIEKTAIKEGWKKIDSGIMFTLNEMFYQGSAKGRDKISSVLADKKNMKEK